MHLVAIWQQRVDKRRELSLPRRARHLIMMLLVTVWRQSGGQVSHNVADASGEVLQRQGRQANRQGGRQAGGLARRACGSASSCEQQPRGRVACHCAASGHRTRGFTKASRVQLPGISKEFFGFLRSSLDFRRLQYDSCGFLQMPEDSSSTAIGLFGFPWMSA